MAKKKQTKNGKRIIKYLINAEKEENRQKELIPCLWCGYKTKNKFCCPTCASLVLTAISDKKRRMQGIV